MPFKSYKQKSWMKHHLPDVYDKWIKKYGKRPKKTKKSKR